MAQDFESMEQVIKFLYSLDEESLRTVLQKAQDATDKKLEACAAAEEKAARKLVEKADAQNTKEIDRYVESLKTREQKQLEHLSRVQEALEKKYAYFVDLDKQAATEGFEVMSQLTEEGIKEYRKYIEAKHGLEKDFAKSRFELERGQSIFATNKEVKDHQMTAGGQAAVDVTRSVAGANLVPKLTGNLVADVTKIVSLVNDLVDYTKEGLRRQSAVAAGGALGLAGSVVSGEFDELGRVVRETAIVFPEAKDSLFAWAKSLRENMPSMPMKDFQIALNGLFLESKQTGVGMEQLIETMSTLVRDMGLSSEEARRSIMIMGSISEELKSKGVDISTSEFSKYVVDASKSMRLLGVDINTTTAFIGRLGNGLEKHLVSVDQLVQMATGATKKDEGIQAFIAQQFTQSVTGAVGEQLRKAIGGDAMAALGAFRLISEGKLYGEDDSRGRAQRQMGITEQSQLDELKSQLLAFPAKFAEEQAKQMGGKGGALSEFGSQNLIYTSLVEMMGGPNGIRSFTQAQLEELKKANLEGLGMSVDKSNKMAEERAATLGKTQELVKDQQSNISSIKSTIELIWVNMLGRVGTPQQRQAAERRARGGDPIDPSLTFGPAKEALGMNDERSWTQRMFNRQDDATSLKNVAGDLSKFVTDLSKGLASGTGLSEESLTDLSSRRLSTQRQQQLQEIGINPEDTGQITKRFAQQGVLPGFEQKFSLELSGFKSDLSVQQKKELSDLLEDAVKKYAQGSLNRQMLQEISQKYRTLTSGGAK